MTKKISNKELQTALEAAEYEMTFAKLSDSLETSIPKAKFYYGLKGVCTEHIDSCVNNSYFGIRKVINPPRLSHLFSKISKTSGDFYAIARYAATIEAELLMGDESDVSKDLLHTMSWYLIGLLKLAGSRAIVAPLMASRSWDLINNAEQNSVDFSVIQDIPSQIILNGVVHGSEWISNRFKNLLMISEREKNLRFQLAFSIFQKWNHTTDLRVGLANLWTALEAIFGDARDRQVKKALAERISSWCEVSENEVSHLYKARCDAVHGRRLADSSIVDQLNQSLALLEKSLILSIERCQQPLKDA